MALNIAARHAVKGMVRTHLYDLTNPLIKFLIPTPAAEEVSINPQDQFQELYDFDCNGNKVLAFKTENQSQTSINLTFSSATIDIKAAALKTRMKATATGQIPYTRGWLTVPDVASPTLPAAATGVYGQGVVADQPALASYINDKGIAIPLVQGTFATPGATLGFGIGVNGALSFSNDLRGKVVSVGGTLFTATNYYQNDDIIQEMGLEAMFVDSYKQLNILYVPSFSPERQQTSVANPQQAIAGTINGSTWKIISVQKENLC
jgi:hypothetical protein